MRCLASTCGAATENARAVSEIETANWSELERERVFGRVGRWFSPRVLAVAFRYSVEEGDGGIDRSSTARVERNGSVRFGELQHNGLRNLRNASVTLCLVLAE
jgi:hypothetical protein